jgi:uncharacterized protein YndB with AHSA1/START domain
MTTVGNLEVTTPSDLEVQMTRVFDAPRELVYRALTTPELMKRWLIGGADWPMGTCDMDVRVGGAYHWVWSGPNGQEMGMNGVFAEVMPPDRMVYSQKFDQAWTPGENQVTTTLVQRGSQTIVTITTSFPSKESRDGLLQHGMAEGAAQGYDRLEAVLKTLS